MKTAKKAMLLTVCALVLVAATVMGTLAYLTSADEVVNTFTVGKIAITLDEAPTDRYGKLADGERCKANEYKLIPGHKYLKDPTIHVAPDSEECYLFVTVENGIQALEAADTTIATQMKALGWSAMDDYPNVYTYKTVVTPATASNVGDLDAGNFVVFQNFTIGTDVEAEDMIGDNLDYSRANVTVKAYAVQTDSFADAKSAWEATFGAPMG